MSNERLARQILAEIDRNPSISQRQLSVNLGVSIGIVNWHMKRFVTKGLVKLQTAPVRRYLYYPDPRRLRREGEADGGNTSRPPSTSFAGGRLQYEALFGICAASHWGNVIFLGDSELVELADMAHSRTDGVQVRCILDPSSTRDRRGKIPVHASVPGALREFPNRRVDALIGTHFDLRVAECYDLEAIRKELGLDQSRFLVPAFLQ